MTRLNFESMSIPMGVRGKERKTGDARESFADVIYNTVSGIKAHRLAFKIYESEGMTDYSDEEVSLIKATAEKYCTPNFIDGLREQIEQNTNS